MRRFFVLSCLLLTILAATSQTASAETVTLTNAGATAWNGVSAGPYAATLNGNSITMLCLSYDRHVSVGQTWQVTLNSLTAGGVAGALYGAQPDALLKYQQAAWLHDQLSSNPSQTGDIHGAIWNIFNPGLTPDSSGSNAWLSIAQSQNFSGYDFSKFRILTPDVRTANGPQEFLTSVPEPTTMILLGTGLAGVIGATRRKRKASNSGAA